MNFLEGSIEAEVMDGIKVDEDLGQEISDLMFVFDNLLQVDDRGIQVLLREVSTDALKVALRGLTVNLLIRSLVTCRSVPLKYYVMTWKHPDL